MSTIFSHMIWPWCRFRMHVWNVVRAARWKYRMQKLCQKLPSAHHRTTLPGYIFATKAHIDNWKKLVKWQHLLHMPLQYGEFRPANVWDLLASLGHPSKFQRVLCLGFITAPTSLNWGQPDFALCLALSCTCVLCMHFGGFCRLTEFCQLQNSLCVQLLHSPKLAALLYGTWALASAKVCGVVQGMELWNLRKGCHLYLAGGSSHWASVHILVKSVDYFEQFDKQQLCSWSTDYLWRSERWKFSKSQCCTSRGGQPFCG